MPISIPGKVVVFDYGEVISYSPSEADRQALMSIARVPEDLFWPPYWANRDALDGGTLSIRDYWLEIARHAGVEFSESRIQQLWIADYRSWLSVNPDTYDILVALRDGRTRIALLSNAGFDFGDYFRRGPMGALFERVFVSAEMGRLKPESAIYLEVLRELDIEAHDMIFIDNKAVNIDGAAELGIDGHVFTTAQLLHAFLDDRAATASA
ncbi:putative hydrolase of the HAD superfamily [Agreia bicolorata]|uniref:Putative hydrolase of the HAD superfamily n=1 Tax=Agreia bicolorata TaxID=110935 RepID=A0A1T4XBM4_9MICO|nr:HAD-IA family hydrolase [Agreia bicolorata]SKA86787.1 putative hydrolase of the HAD superfamily [Agreia bicolorata]